MYLLTIMEDLLRETLEAILLFSILEWQWLNYFSSPSPFYLQTTHNSQSFLVPSCIGIRFIDVSWTKAWSLGCRGEQTLMRNRAPPLRPPRGKTTWLKHWQTQSSYTTSLCTRALLYVLVHSSCAWHSVSEGRVYSNCCCNKSYIV